MANEDLKRHFVQLIKQACERYLAEGGSLGWENNFEIEGIELVPAEETQTVDYSYSVFHGDGETVHSEAVHKQAKPFEFVARYWNEYGDEDTAPCRFEKRLGFVEVATEVGKLIAGQIDQIKACNAMHWLRGDTHRD